MLPNISGGHTAYQNFVVTNLRKYYPNPDALVRSTPSLQIFIDILTIDEPITYDTLTFAVELQS